MVLLDGEFKCEKHGWNPGSDYDEESICVSCTLDDLRAKVKADPEGCERKLREFLDSPDHDFKAPADACTEWITPDDFPALPKYQCGKPRSSHSNTQKVNQFDVLKLMSERNLDIRYAPDILRLDKVKAGTQVTVGVGGDVVAGFASGRLVGGLMLWDKDQFRAILHELEFPPKAEPQKTEER